MGWRPSGGEGDSILLALECRKAKGRAMTRAGSATFFFLDVLDVAVVLSDS